jgi:hypothetical protein
MNHTAAANEVLDDEINSLAALNESDLADYLQWIDEVLVRVCDPTPENIGIVKIE